MRGGVEGGEGGEGGEGVNARMPTVWHLEERQVGLEAASAASGAVGAGAVRTLGPGERTWASNSLIAVA